jgi:hypothetical protein
MYRDCSHIHSKTFLKKHVPEKKQGLLQKDDLKYLANLAAGCDPLHRLTSMNELISPIADWCAAGIEMLRLFVAVSFALYSLSQPAMPQGLRPT